jgi:lipid-binding SYLF domain-containing protein
MLEQLKKLFTSALSGLQKEQSVIRSLHEQVQATLERLFKQDPGLKGLIDRAHAYAVFPSVGKAAAVLGGAYGKGEVFRGDDLIGYAAVAQLTIGVQLGGDTFDELVVFDSKETLDRFKRGKTAFAANAAAVLVKAGAAASANFESGAAVFVYSEGGMMLEAAIGGQRFFFRPAVLGRAENAKAPTNRKTTKKKPRTKGARGRIPGKKTRPLRKPSRSSAQAKHRARKR